MTADGITLLERRMLAAIRPVDPFGRRLTGQIEAKADGARFLTKDDGTVILQSWSGLAGFDTSFDSQPVAPAPGTQTLTVTLLPATNTLMPRLITLNLPRDSDPARFGEADSLFHAVPATFPASTAMAKPGQACGLIVSVRRDTDQAPIAGAVVKLTPDADPLLSTVSITNRHGEALLMIAGLPLARMGASATLTTEHRANLELFANADSIRFDGSEAEPLDPDATIAAAPAVSSTIVTLQSRATTHAHLSWSPP